MFRVTNVENFVFLRSCDFVDRFLWAKVAIHENTRICTNKTVSQSTDTTMAGGNIMPRQLVLISLLAFMTGTPLAQNTNSSSTGRPRSTGTNTNRSAVPPKPTETQQPAATPSAAFTSPVKPRVPTQAPGADTVLAAFERLLNGIRNADVKVVSSVYWNSPSLILFNNNATMTRGWEQMRKNRESSYPYIKGVKLEIRDLAVTMLGRDGAVITCVWTQSQTYKDVPETATGRMTLVFKRVGRDWKAVHLHTSPDKQDPSRVLPSEESPSPAPSATPSPTPNPLPNGRSRPRTKS
ncbi:hypothetical protein BH20ACI3_BH20ACI3_37760 [soil metagenome]